MGDDEQGEEESVKLQRMLSSLIADKRKMFDLLTKILDRGKKDKDAALVQYVEQATGLWTDMMMEEHDHDQKCIENVHHLQKVWLPCHLIQWPAAELEHHRRFGLLRRDRPSF